MDETLRMVTMQGTLCVVLATAFPPPYTNSGIHTRAKTTTRTLGSVVMQGDLWTMLAA